ncbi:MULTISPECIES: acyl-CoA dehydrogenase family protein [Frankia]|nr:MULTISPECIES: acyl-CoA dehydrogenase family protein [Frankia]
MEFVFTEEQDGLRSMVRDLLAETSPEAEVRRLMQTPDGFDPAVWRGLAELGLTGLAIPEHYGGAGFGPVEVGVVMEEAGAALLCAPYLSTVVLAPEALLAAGDEAANKAYLPGIADGSLRATFAAGEHLAAGEHAAGGHPAGASVAASVSPADGGWRVTGTVGHVVDGASADVVLVVAAAPGGPSLFGVEADAAGLTRTPTATMDATRRQARLAFDAAPARLVGAEGAGAGVRARVRDVAATQLAAEQVGGAQRVLDMAVEYAKLRVQFGRPIGSFQAIKHRCADLLLRVESARSAAYHALWAAADGAADLPVAARLAGAYCSTAFYTCAEENILIHGGIGYTWEHPAHLYLRRAAADRVMFGDPATHRAALADLLGV